MLDFNEWRASQAWQAFSAYESIRKQLYKGGDGFSWCTLEGGANSGTYEKPLLDKKMFTGLKLAAERSLLRLPPARPVLPTNGLYVIEYLVEQSKTQ